MNIQERGIRMLDLLYDRRSIRKYSPAAIEKDKIQDLVKAALLAPSGRGIQPQRFIIVEDHDLLQKLSLAREHGSAFLSGAPLVIVVLADSSLTDVWTEDASIAAIIIQLAAKSMGLGSCWVQVRNRNQSEGKTTEEYIQEVLNIPRGLKVECMIGLGYPAEQKLRRTEQDLQYQNIFVNQYGTEFLN
ncbi:MAG: NAD(P)H nitroreductase [Dehalobacter sp. 4CP]|nr:NAD(P)H nitroreductase [Dehalobacter sp. 4CP]